MTRLLGIAGSTASRPRCFLFPGMGATAAMHRQVVRRVPGIRACDWPDHDGCRSFADFAERCIDQHGIRVSDVVAGSSMGGMIACEIAKRLGITRVLLVGSCHHPQAIYAHRWAGLGADVLDDRLMRLVCSKGHVSLLSQMAMTVGPGFMRWSLRALRDWQGVALTDIPGLRAIHGCLDPIIPIVSVRPMRRIATGGHLIALSHPQRIAAFIAECLDGPRVQSII